MKLQTEVKAPVYFGGQIVKFSLKSVIVVDITAPAG